MIKRISLFLSNVDRSNTGRLSILLKSGLVEKEKIRFYLDLGLISFQEYLRIIR